MIEIERAEQSMLFNRDALDDPTRAFLEEQEAELDSVLKRTSEEIGVILLRVKARLPHGQYMPWLASRGISQPTAWRCVQVAQGKEVKKSFIMNDLPLIESSSREAEPQAGLFEQWQADNLTLGLDAFGDVPVEPEPVPDVVDQESKERRDSHVMRIMGSSESPEWYTPREIVDLVMSCLGEIDVDPCSNSHERPSVPARVLYTREDNGLAYPWHGKVYLNPPYGSEIPAWIEKLVQEYEEEQHIEEAIALIPARIDTQWIQPLYTYPMCHIRGRLQFENAQYSAPFPSILVYLGRRPGKFIATFKDLGPIMGRIG